MIPSSFQFRIQNPNLNFAALSSVKKSCVPRKRQHTCIHVHRRRVEKENLSNTTAAPVSSQLVSMPSTRSPRLSCAFTLATAAHDSPRDPGSTKSLPRKQRRPSCGEERRREEEEKVAQLGLKDRIRKATQQQWPHNNNGSLIAAVITLPTPMLYAIFYHSSPV
jgi:hypothetical protein